MIQTDQKNKDAYTQLEALLTWAIVGQGEDGLELSQPKAIGRQVAILEIIYHQLESIYDSTPRMLKDFVPLSMSPPLKQEGNLAKVEVIRKKYVKELLDKCYAIRTQVKSVSPFSEVFFIQDAISLLEGKKDEKGNVQPPTLDAFIKSVAWLTRKYKSLRIIFRNPVIVSLKQNVNEDEQKKLIRAIHGEGSAAFNHLNKSYVSFANWVKKHEGIYQEAKDIWHESATDVWQKLRAGNIDSEYSQALERLVFTMSMKKFYQHYRDNQPYADIDTVFDAPNGLISELEEDVFFLEEEIEKDKLERTAAKLGFDFLGWKPNKDQSTEILPPKEIQAAAILIKELLYYGEIVKHQALVTVQERELVETELAIKINELSQEFIIDAFDLKGKQSAFAHRLGGYKQKWFANTGRTLKLLPIALNKYELIRYFDNCTYFILSKQYQAPIGNEHWYKPSYETIRETVMSDNSI